MALGKVKYAFCSDQLSTVRSHVDVLKRLSSQLCELEDLFRSPQTGEMCSVGSALQEVTSRLNSALSSFDTLNIIPDESSFASDGSTECDDDNCRELRESIMLVVQSLYKVRDADAGSQTEDRQLDSDEGNVALCLDVVNGGSLCIAIVIGVPVSFC